MNCGEGWPNELAFDIVNKGTFCIGDWFDGVFGSMYPAPFCQPVSKYVNPETNKPYKFTDGLPDVADCESTSFFNYYLSPESLTLFRALYENTAGF